MKNIKKILTLLVAVLMLGALLTGCGKGGVFINRGYGDGNYNDGPAVEAQTLVGKWAYSQEYNGQTVGSVIEFKADGIVNVYSMYGDTVVLVSSDSYEVTGNTLTVDGEPGSFKLHDGKLTLIEGDMTMTLEPYYGDLPEGGSDFDEDDFDFDFDEGDFDFDFDEDDFDFDFDEGDFDFDFDEGDFDFDYNGGAAVAPSGLVGNWACTQNRNGSVIVLGMVIRADGTMDSNTIVDGVVTHSATASYEIQGNQIIAYVDGDTEGDPASFELNGNTLTITEGGTSMVFERVG